MSTGGTGVRLVVLTAEMLNECAGLRVRDDQQVFVDSNLYCIAECALTPSLRPFAIYAGETMVGLVVTGILAQERGLIQHMMIDERHQGRGYGEAALGEAVRVLCEQGCRAIELTYWPDNPAARLYARFGFVATGQVRDDEPVMALRCPAR